MAGKSKAKNIDFESALAELEALVTKMEAGDLSLEESLKAFEQGVKLTRECQTQLTRAEQRVKKLIDDNGHLESLEFEEAEGEDDGSVNEQ